MLFLLAMEPQYMLFRHAQNSRILSFLHQNCAYFIVSLYADDATLFINPKLLETLQKQSIVSNCLERL
jgi:hypothetical protein